MEMFLYFAQIWIPGKNLKTEFVNLADIASVALVSAEKMWKENSRRFKKSEDRMVASLTIDDFSV
jgi:hypothetical protein